MRVKPLLSKITPTTFIEDYLQAHGVEQTSLYLSPEEGCLDNPRFYPNVDKGAELLKQAVDDDWKIGLEVDIDVDGNCSATLIRQFLNKQYNIDPVIYIRKGKAHGLKANMDEDIVQQIIADKIQLLIMPDAGTNDKSEAKDLLDNGCRVLCLDHHEQSVENPYAVIVNHHLLDGWKGLETGNIYHWFDKAKAQEPLENLNPLNCNLSGTGVTAKFIEYYCKKYGIHTPYMNDLVAMSIISDSCDLTALENRYYVHNGLHNVQNPLIQAMLPSTIKRYGLTPTGYSWAMIPLINAVCREEETDNKYKIFDAFSGHGDIEEALKICRSAHRNQSKVVKQAVEEIEPSLDTKHKVIIGFADKSLANQVGLIANKFQSKYHKPVILLREADSITWSGSLRSPVGLREEINNSNLANALGHSKACGILVRKSNLNRLIDCLNNLDIPTTPEIDVAGCIAPRQINNKLCKACVDHAELWGQGVPEPTFYINAEIDETNVQVFEKRTTTVKIIVNEVDFLLFMATPEQVDKLTQKGKKSLSLIVTLSTNEWNGVVKPQGKIKQFEVDKAEDKDDFWRMIFDEI